MPRKTSKKTKASRNKKLSKKPSLVSAHDTRFEGLKKRKKSRKNWKKYLSRELQRLDRSCPLSTRKGTILVTAYKYTSMRIEKNNLDKFIGPMVNKGHSKETVKNGLKRNPFHVCLKYFCSKGVCYQSPKQLSKWARLLHYAYLHNVKTKHLLGFLHQEGSYEAINRRYNQIIADADINSSRNNATSPKK